MRFSETIKLTDDALIVSRRHDAWLMENDHPVYSTRALNFARRALTQHARERQGTVSASSLGECRRYQQFVYIGMPKLPHDQKNAMKMHNGSFMHLRWQMAGLSEGWLEQAEVPLPSNHLQLHGTMDGLLYEGSVLELKSINVNGFSRVTTFGPLVPHLYQMATYLLCSGRDRGVFIYECKDNQEYKEIIVGPDDLPMREAAELASSVLGKTVQQELFEPLEKCIDKQGYLYASCPYRDRCLDVHAWEEAVA